MSLNYKKRIIRIEETEELLRDMTWEELIEYIKEIEETLSNQKSWLVNVMNNITYSVNWSKL